MKSVLLLVGFGGAGRKHLENVRNYFPDWDVVVLRTTSKIAPSSQLPQGVIVMTDSITHALKFRPKAAIISTPAPFHLNIATELVKNSVPVLIERPLAASLDEAKSFKEKNLDSSLLLVGYNFRFSPTAYHIKTLLASKEVGKVLSFHFEMGHYLPFWRPNKKYAETVAAQSRLGGGVLLELSHVFDLAYWFFGEPLEMTAQVEKLSGLQIDVEDTANVHIKFKEVVGHVQLDMLQMKASRFLKIMGSDATLIWNIVDNSVTKYASDGVISDLTLPKKEDWNTMNIYELHHFFEFAQGKVRPRVTFQDGYVVLKMVESAKRSSREQRTIKWDHND